MTKFILGLNSIGFNTSASLIKNNKVVAAVEEERLSRVKRTRAFPTKAIKYCLDQGNIRFEELDSVAISWNPLINLEKFDLNESQNSNYIPSILSSTINNILKDVKIHKKEFFSQNLYLNNNKKIKIFFINHHLSHASMFFLSGFKEANILTTDAFGENQCIGFYSGENNQIKLKDSQNFPHSLGSFYSTFTEFCGFRPQSEEWKLMGASAYGQNSNLYKKVKNLVSYDNKKNFYLNLKYFNHYMFHRPNYYSDDLIKYLSLKPNKLGKNLNKRYFNLAYAAQKVFEEIYYDLIIKTNKISKSKNLVIAGGSALNCVANGKIMKGSGYKNIFVPPVPDDSGAGLGAALYVNNSINKEKKRINLFNNFLGPAYKNNEILEELKKFKIKYEYFDNIENQAVDSIIQGKIIAWFQGSLEFGDRALGNRSILADPRNKDIKDKINKSIKYREAFRPFAPAILEEKVSDFFENAQTSYYMEKALIIKKDKRKLIPSVTHVDGTGRLQTINKKLNKKFYDLVNHFYKKTDIPILLNTSFNVQGEPLVASISDALKNFYLSGLDELYIGNYKIKKL